MTMSARGSRRRPTIDEVDGSTMADTTDDDAEQRTIQEQVRAMTSSGAAVVRQLTDD